MVAALTACGGGSGSSSSAPEPVATANAAIAAAAQVPANDTATNGAAPFSVLQAAGVPVVTVAGPPKVNFTVFSDGKVVPGLTAANVSVIIAKLVPGNATGKSDQWVSYTYRKETASAGVGPNGVPAKASAMQATTDGKQTVAALLAAQLVYNPDGYYSYTFKTDITDPAQTNGVTFERNRTHRVAIQLSYKNAAGETILVNPYFDFTVDAAGKAVAVTDPALTRKMADVASCNGCHEKLALHGGGRVDTQYCVMCHNAGTVDANSGNELDMSTMVHKIHAGRLLNSKLAAGGEDYTIWGYQNSKHSYGEVGFPQDLRNCKVCHSASNPNTPQGDNWKTKPSKEACLTCHANNVGSYFDTVHAALAQTRVGPGASAKSLSNADCVSCHAAGTPVSAENVHWNQNEENAAKYKMNIEEVGFDAAARKVTVKYFLSDPTSSNAAYNLITSECTGAGTSTVNCANTTKFGNLRFYVAYQNMVGQPAAVTEFSSYNNGGSGANAYAYKGTNVGGNHYTVDIPLPADTATAIAAGTARVISIGQIKEPRLQIKSAAVPRPAVTPEVVANRVNVVVQHTFKDVVLSGDAMPRRQVVSNEKCNVCHGALGTTSGSNTLAAAFHSGARNTVESCALCHDANRSSSGNMMTNGLNLYEPYQFKRMIHGIHSSSKRTSPFTHGNKVGTIPFAMDGTPLVATTPPTLALGLTAGVENYAAEVAWPGVGINCNACHVNNSFKQDFGTLGSVVLKPTITPAVGTTPAVLEANPNKWLVISPKAATCTSCHDSARSIGHVSAFGGSSFGNMTQAAVVSGPRETCDDCHAPGLFKGVDIVHGQK